MKFTTLLALATTVIALPSPHPTTPPTCLTDTRANYIVERERVYLQKANITDARIAGEELFADDFVQYGDSINSLRGDPVSLLPPKPNYHFDCLYVTNTPSSSAPKSNQTAQPTSTTPSPPHPFP